jgi:acylphosphatase
MKRVHLFIFGRVQGVCFRRETRLRAMFLKLKGFVKNLEDGRVEAVIEGDENKIDKLINWARRGPALAKVKNVQILEENYIGEYSNFDIIY